MQRTNFFLGSFLLLILMGCQPTATPDANQPANPPAEGFRAEASDAKAIALADSVMARMGGRKAWDDTRYLRWTFFGRRTLLWDKQEQRVRIDIPADSTVLLYDLADNTGRAQVGGEEITDTSQLSDLLERAKAIWINDAYWLVMPYKLKDSGVALTYLGVDTTAQGQSAEVLQLTFEGVGNTPQNKYHVYVDPAEYLVTQWAYFPTADAEEPAIVTPWSDYQEYGRILLSGDRGRGALTDLGVYETVPESAFTVFSSPVVSDFR